MHLITNDVGHLFMCVLAIPIASFVKCSKKFFCLLKKIVLGHLGGFVRQALDF